MEFVISLLKKKLPRKHFFRIYLVLYILYLLYVKADLPGIPAPLSEETNWPAWIFLYFIPFPLFVNRLWDAGVNVWVALLPLFWFAYYYLVAPLWSSDALGAALLSELFLFVLSLSFIVNLCRKSKP